MVIRLTVTLKNTAGAGFRGPSVQRVLQYCSDNRFALHNPAFGGGSGWSISIGISTC